MIVVVLGAFLLLACWAIHLLFGEVRKSRLIVHLLRERLTAQRDEHMKVLVAHQGRVGDLEKENDRQKDFTIQEEP